MSRGLVLTTAAGLVSPEDALAFFNIMNHRKKRLSLTISANTMNLNLRSALQAAGWSFSAAPSTSIDITLIINSGIYVWSNSVSTPAIDATNLPAGSVIRLFNSGYILGQGGAGGGYNMPSGVNGQAGGNAINTDVHMIIDNQAGYICGGGGGGGSVSWDNSYHAGGGGGAGGGDGGDAYRSSDQDVVSGGAGGALNSSGFSGATQANGRSSGGGGGRFPPPLANAPTTTGPSYSSSFIGRAGLGGKAGGTGGIRTYASDAPGDAYGAGTKGGDGGGANIAGGAGAVMDAPSSSYSYRLAAGGGGGGWGQPGGVAAGKRNTTPAPTIGSGGANGKAINVSNGRSVIWIGGSASSDRAYGT